MTGLLLITHGGLGQELLSAASMTLGGVLPIPTASVAVHHSDTLNLPALENKARQALRTVTRQGGVLILTDAYGATPSNTAVALATDKVRVIAGVNLPMLLRVFNYAHRDLNALVDIAVAGGQRGIITHNAASTAYQMSGDHAET